MFLITHKMRSITLVLVLRRNVNNKFLWFHPVATGAFLTLHQGVHTLLVHVWPLGWKLKRFDFCNVLPYLSKGFGDHILNKTMARVVKLLRTLRNHWKKSTFAVCVLSYGGHWLYGKHWWVTPSLAYMLDKIEAIFLWFTCNDLYLISDNVLRKEACLLARVRQDFILHM